MVKYSVYQNYLLILTVFVSLITSILCLFIPYSPCDESNTLDPCRSHPSLPGSIVCENIRDLTTFVRVLRCNRKKNMQEIFLVESTIDFLPLYIVDFCGFTFLNLKTVSMSKLLDGNDMIRLEQLHLDNVTISTPWTWEPLAILIRLLRFSVSNMHVEILNGSLVDNLNENLQSFMLTSTKTASISDYALQKFENMVYISVQNNEIEYLRRSMFPRPSKLKYFYFGKNKITHLPADIFHDMPHLEVVDLQDNVISELHHSTFKNIWRGLAYALLQGNPLKCNCKMLWITKPGTPSVFQGECYAPKDLFGKEIRDLRLSDFHCI